MPPPSATPPPTKTLVDAVVEYVSSGTFPNPDVAVAPVSGSVLAGTFTRFESEKAASYTRLHNTDPSSVHAADSWLAAANQLRTDVETSKADAKSITDRVETLTRLRAAHADAAAKTKFLDRELAFSQSLRASLELVRSQGEAVAGVVEMIGRVERARRDRWRKGEGSAGTTTTTTTTMTEFRDTAGPQLVLVSKRIGTLSRELEGLGPLGNTRFAKMLRIQLDELTRRAAECVKGCWQILVWTGVDTSSSSEPVSRVHIDESGSDDAIEAATELGVFDDLVEDTFDTFARRILVPAFGSSELRPDSILTYNAPTISVERKKKKKKDKSATSLTCLDVLDNLTSLIAFFDTRHPGPVTSVLASRCAAVVSDGICAALTASLPIDLAEYDVLDQVLNRLDSVIKSLATVPVCSPDRLTRWKSHVSMAWLAGRKAVALDLVRRAFVDGLAGREIVLTSLRPSKIAGELNPEQPSDGRRPVSSGGERGSEAVLSADDREEEEDDTDADAWGFDDPIDPEDNQDDRPAASKPDDKEAQSEADADTDADADEGSAWGWDDDDPIPSSPTESKSGPAQAQSTTEPKPKSVAASAHPAGSGSGPKGRYQPRNTITGMPAAIFKIIKDAVDDAIELGKPSSRYAALSSAAPGLCSVPTIVLAMYRAISRVQYDSIDNGDGTGGIGNLLLHNDAVWLSWLLEQFEHEYFPDPTTGSSSVVAAAPSSALPSPVRSRFKLGSDISDLLTFATQTQDREVSLQKSRLGTILDRAEHFVSISAPADRDRCAHAIDQAVAFLVSLIGNWKTVLLPRSVVLAHLVGVVFDSMIDRIVDDVLARTDISETASEVLSRYLGTVETAAEGVLSDLINSPTATIPTTTTTTTTTTATMGHVTSGTHTDNSRLDLSAFATKWFRLKYMTIILVSSLKDIEHMWCESDLSLEYGLDEVVGLVEALFAATEYRDRAIGQITAAGSKKE